MDIIIILKWVVVVLAVIGAVYVCVKGFVHSAERLGLAGCLLGIVIVLFLLKVVFPFGSIQDTIVAYTALIAFTVIGALSILRWFKILPYKYSLHT